MLPTPTTGGVGPLHSVVEVDTIIRAVGRSGEWVIIVCPNQFLTAEIGRLVSVMVPKNAVTGGRTFLFTNQGRLSIVTADDDIFIQDGAPFAVAFIGWTLKDDGKGMTKWTAKASRIFQG